jgi:ATP synthase protein I
MSGRDDDAPPPDREAARIAESARRKERAARNRAESPLYALGFFGLIGWSVALPTIAGVALGLWLDARYPSGRSWTLALLLGGVALGCLNAWFWVLREGRDD